MLQKYFGFFTQKKKVNSHPGFIKGPGVVSPHRDVPDSIPRPHYVPGFENKRIVTTPQSGNVILKTSKQIERMRDVCRLGRSILDEGSSTKITMQFTIIYPLPNRLFLRQIIIIE